MHAERKYRHEFGTIAQADGNRGRFEEGKCQTRSRTQQLYCSLYAGCYACLYAQRLHVAINDRHCHHLSLASDVCVDRLQVETKIEGLVQAAANGDLDVRTRVVGGDHGHRSA